MMRWTLTSPDGLGDFFLRLPWLKAMESKGWQLQLVARPPTLEAARLVGLEIQPVAIGESPYEKRARLQKNPYRSEHREIRKYHPNLVFFGPSQPTFFEEQAARHLGDLRLGGFVVEEEFWGGECLSDPRTLAENYAVRVPVKDEDDEPARNAHAARLLLGEVNLPPYLLPAETEGRLNSLPLPMEEGEYLVVSPGRREKDYFTGMGELAWARELRLLEERQPGFRFVFAGSEAERPANAAIFAKLQPDRHLNLTGAISSLESLAALLWRSSGYVGKDSGMMHLASLLRKKVVAVFGGGHWKRFLPTSPSAAILTVKVPCRGCDWRCPFPEPYCASRLSEGSIAEAWSELSSSSEPGVRIFEQEPSAEVRLDTEGKGGPRHAQHEHAIRRQRLQRLRAEALQPMPVKFWKMIRGHG